ncbi:hypothetical protein Vafri_3563 [Volvox africanus]|uniref:WW domain-containing protein n=1 Tax=Volvox africanus TaxID=51714 RepID=A0A8J4ATP1_9CHLO|nr:hypothetical protein Vafri_3563 [Volvox africanus]
MSSLEAVLIARGINADVARACTHLFGSYEEAFPYIDPPLLPGDIKEYYSLKYHRYYYHCTTSDTTTWELPPQLQLSEWMLDASISGQDVRTCRKLLSALLWAVQANAHKPHSDDERFGQATAVQHTTPDNTPGNSEMTAIDRTAILREVTNHIRI